MKKKKLLKKFKIIKSKKEIKKEEIIDTTLDADIEADIEADVAVLKNIFKDNATRGFESHKDWIKLNLSDLDSIIDTKNNRGFPVGTCVLLSGTSQTGKTLLLAVLANMFAKQGGSTILADAEGGFSPEFAKDITGLDIRTMISIRTNVIEEIFRALDVILQRREKIVVDYCKKNKIRIDEVDVKNVLKPMGFFYDSYKACISEKEKSASFIKNLSDEAKETGAKTDVLLSQRRVQVLNREFPKIISRLLRARVTFVIVTHMYDSIAAFGGMKAAGGRAFEHFPSLEIRMKNKGKIVKTVKGKKIVLGRRITFSTEKNRFGAPYRETDLKLLFNKGFVSSDFLDE